MIWYLLSPLRGTTQPPRLSSNSQVRRAFYRHGKITAQHWLVVMLLAVAIAMAFSYPTVFLSGNPTAGLATYPQHVWTSAKALDNEEASVDVEMRQVWVHGSYMNALDKDVLKRALAVQQSLVADERLADFTANTTPAMDDKLPSSTLQWGYHSPLMYWNNSANVIDADLDLLKTINEQKYSISSLNVVLRPASVFAGKKFARQQLLAADALVITLLNKGDDGVGHEWQSRMQTLTDGVCKDCTLFPYDGDVTRHRVYEFSFTPLSMHEHIALTFAYSAMAVYVLLSFRRMKAFHSRFGLVVTAITQMTFSILASFTICGMLRINLSMIPQNAYPFVVLVLGVENMFRLINAVLAYPPTMATELRIANALGDIGPISVAAAAQNLLILFVLSTVVSPGVAAFCAFAAIATLFDAFFLLTFFVAVLNVDIRRLELQDAIVARHNQPRHRRRPSPVQHTWFDALLQGRLPFSTRMAGTAVTTTFILSLNYHFFEHKEKATNFRRLLGLVRGTTADVGDLDTFAPPPMNATLTPGEWMRMQDYDTAKEVLRLARPGADSFVIRLFAPLVIVLPGSDRTDVSQGRVEWAHALRSFTIHHFYPVAVAVVFGVAFVAVLMNFLLYDEAGDEDNDIALEQLEQSLTLETVGLPHTLDIVKMSSNESGHFVTVALDRTIAVSIVDSGRQTYNTVSVPSAILHNIQWPIRTLAIDDNAEWIACHCANDSVLVYNRETGSTISTLIQYPDDNPAVVFAFASLPASGGSKLYFITLTSGGRLAMACLENREASGSDLSTTPLVGASIVDTFSLGKQLLLVTEDASIISHSWGGVSWIPANKGALRSQESASSVIACAVTLQVVSDFDVEFIVAITSNCAVFLSSTNLSHVATFDFEGAGIQVDRLLLGTSRKCPACGSFALRKVAAVTTAPPNDECSLALWSVDDGNDACICLTPKSAMCKSFKQATCERHTINAPEAWSAVKSQAVLGLRKRRQRPQTSSSEQPKPTAAELRRRRHVRQTTQADDSLEQWEAYRLSIGGDLETIDIPTTSGGDVGAEAAALYVSSAGPAIALDSQTIAVAFGNTVKVVRASRRGSITRTAVPSRQSSVSKRTTTRKTR